MSVFFIIDFDAFSAKKHKIQGNVVALELIAPPKHEQPLDREDWLSTIEVLYPDSLETKMLEVYFQGPKSGGGEDKEIEWIRNIEQGKCRIKFMSPEGSFFVDYVSCSSNNVQPVVDMNYLYFMHTVKYRCCSYFS